MRFASRSALLMVLAACRPATDSSYRGPALVTIHGQLVLAPEAQAPAEPIRLAVIWTPFPNFTSASSGAGKSVFAQDVPYQPSFPVAYAFDLTTLPPANVLGDLSQVGGTGGAARGYLVAYVDANHNGTLDLIPPGGTAVDEVLGASILPIDPKQSTFVVQFTDGVPPPYEGALPNGFSLLDPAMVPFDTTSVDIYLTDSGDLDWLSCEEVLISDAPDPTQACQRPKALRVQGQVGNRDGSSYAMLTVTDGNFPADDKFIIDATVTVNGVPVPYLDDPLSFAFASLQAGLSTPGAPSVVLVQEPGFPDLQLTVPPVGAFTLTAPAAPAAVAAGSPVDIAWTAAPGASTYDVNVIPGIESSLVRDGTPPLVTTSGTSVQLPTPAGTPLLYVEVDAKGVPAQSASGSSVIATNSQTQEVSVSQSFGQSWPLFGTGVSDYTLTGDPTGTAADSLRLQSSTADAGVFGATALFLPAAAYLGQRVRLHAIVDAASITGSGGLWMRVDQGSTVLAFDSMQNRPLTGTLAPAAYDIVLDVPTAATELVFGALLDGSGALGVSGLGIDLVDTSVPTTNAFNTGWFLAGSQPQAYVWSGDPTQAPPNDLQLSSTSAPVSAFGTVMTEADPSPHLGKRLRLTGAMTTQGVTGWAGVWMRVDGAGSIPLAFDNMNNRAATGNQSGYPCTVVLDVAPDAVNIAYGVLLVGGGTVEVSALTLEEVDPSVPTTN